jgi:hypothetical protein
MISFPRLLCLAALATATAFAQTSVDSSVSPDSSFADDSKPVVMPPINAQPEYSQPRGVPHEAQSEAAKPSAARPETERFQSAANPPDASASQPASQPTSQPSLQPRFNSGETVLPTATVLRLKLMHAISTASARPGEQFFATLTRPVEVNGHTVIPAGTSVTCRVDGAHPARRFASKPSLTIKALSAHTPNGEVLDFTASVIDTANPHRLDVDQEGRVRGVTPNPMDKVEMGSLAGVGLIAGAVIAGPEGLFIGTASGAALAAGHIVVKHRNLTLPAGTELIFELDAPATIGRPQMGG